MFLTMIIQKVERSQTQKAFMRNKWEFPGVFCRIIKYSVLVAAKKYIF